jgi:glycerol-3-phosphate O-acyltransferase/dihydroxyacetone phosphate acyltransferase
VFSACFAIPGLAITSVFGLAIQYKVEKDRKTALANSRVKKLAKDVVASHKIIYSMILAPVLTGLVAVSVLLIMAWYGHGMWDCLLTGLIAFVVWPWYFYFCVLFSDTAIRHAKQLYVNTLAVFQPRRIEAIRNQRRFLQKKIRGLVDEYGPKVLSDFHERRIIHPRQYNYDLPLNELMDEAFGGLEEIMSPRKIGRGDSLSERSSMELRPVY